MDGKLIDFDRGAEVEARTALSGLLEWCEPARDELALEIALPELNGAQRARRALEQGRSIEEIYRDAVRETRETYVEPV
jgi:carboxylate-amine ligase